MFDGFFSQGSRSVDKLRQLYFRQRSIGWMPIKNVLPERRNGGKTFFGSALISFLIQGPGQTDEP
jgi:hypothetical protein